VFGIYIHIPFCRHKCPFCDFAVTTRNVSQSSSAYMQKLEDEIHSRSRDWSHFTAVDSIFLGGGTPSQLNASQIQKIFNALSTHFTFSPNIEITLECNPEDVDDENIKAWKGIGINRFSLGAQSFNNSILKTLGRVHNTDHVYKAIKVFNKNQIENWSLDLIFGVSGQTRETWTQTIQTALSYDPTHISTYELTIEPKTQFAKQVSKGIHKKISDQDITWMFTHAKETLTKHGFESYETSNASRKGFHCKHNLSCWNGDSYAGFGMSAHSRWVHKQEVYRVENTKSFTNYLTWQQKDFELAKIQQSYKSYIEECVWTALRLSNGVSIKKWNHFEEILGEKFKNRSEMFFSKHLLEIKNNTIRLSPLAWLLADAIALELLS